MNLCTTRERLRLRVFYPVERQFNAEQYRLHRLQSPSQYSSIFIIISYRFFSFVRIAKVFHLCAFRNQCLAEKWSFHFQLVEQLRGLSPASICTQLPSKMSLLLQSVNFHFLAYVNHHRLVIYSAARHRYHYEQFYFAFIA